MYDVKGAVKLEELNKSDTQRILSTNPNHHSHDNFLTAKADEMMFYRCRTSKHVIMLDKVCIQQLQAQFPCDLGSVAVMKPRIENGEAVGSFICSTNSEVFDFVNKQIKTGGEHWKLQEVQKIGVFARWLLGYEWPGIEHAIAGK